MRIAPPKVNTHEKNGGVGATSTVARKCLASTISVFTSSPKWIYDVSHGAVLAQQRHPLECVVVHAKDLPDVGCWVKGRVCYVGGI